MKTKLILLAVAFLTICTSCSYVGSATINSSPQGAQVYEFGTSTLLGVTPFTHTWTEMANEGSQVKNAQHVTVRVVKPGYKTKMEAFSIPLRAENPATGGAPSPKQVMLILEKQQ